MYLRNAQEGQRFYAVMADQVRRYAGDTARWVIENRRKIRDAVIDVIPVSVQGAAAFVPGRAGQIVSGVGIGAQAIKSAHETVGLINERRAGGQTDKVAATAVAARAASVAFNTFGAVGSGAPANVSNGVGTFLSGVGTTLDVVNDTGTTLQREDPGYEMQIYRGQGRNPRLGDGAGDYRPGTSPAQTPSSTTSISTSSDAARHRPNPVSGATNAYGPPVTSGSAPANGRAATGDPQRRRDAAAATRHTPQQPRRGR
ncbi:hypothetical protein ABZ619_17065 [Streptomyces sp. NPDC007851]|uniref:hypothetical protein n=1 Tax=Streptomyces sp. NPDC007851 TaxID=3155008 RepID=UPI0033CB2FDE